MALFVASNVACAVVIRVHQNLYKSVPMYLLYMRVAINDSLFMMLGIVLAVCIFRVAKMSSSSLVLEAKVILFYSSCYLLLSVLGTS